MARGNHAHRQNCDPSAHYTYWHKHALPHQNDAVLIIMTSATAGNAKVGNIWGDLLCMAAQLSFALYLSLFKPLVGKYSLFTINKWMFTWASVMILPFSASHVASIPWAEVPVSAWWETGYVIFFGTYLGYILMMIGQKTLRPTVVSVYNYVQPLVSVSVSVLVGLAVFKGTQALAALLVFSGVWLVIKSKSKHDIDKHDHSLAYEKRHA